LDDAESEQASIESDTIKRLASSSSSTSRSEIDENWG